MSQVVSLASNFAGLNRRVAPQNLDASQSPDTTDARSSNLRLGALGPRNGRAKIFSRTTDTNSLGRAYYPFTGMGVLNTSYGKYRVLSDQSGAWTTTVIPWPGLNAVSTPSQLTGRANVRTRFTQYKNRLYAHNGRDRMRALDGIDWQFAGIAKPSATPTTTPGTPASTINVVAITDTTDSVFHNLEVTCASAHGFSVGDSVTLALTDPMYNGTFKVTSVGSSVKFTYQVPIAIKNTATLSANISAIECTGRVGSITTASAHGLYTGDIITVSCSTSAFNGTFFAQVVSSTVVNVVLPYGTTDYSSQAATGTVKATKLQRVGYAGLVTVANISPFVIADSNPYIHPQLTSSVVISSNVVTVTTSSAHGFVVGQTVELYGQNISTVADDAPLHGIYIIGAVPTSTTFTFALTHTNGTLSGCSAVGYTYGTAILAATGATGATPLTGTYRYFITACNSKRGDAWGRPIESIPSDISDSISAISQSITLSIPATHPDPQVDTWNIYRNKVGEYSTDLASDQQDFWLVGTVALGTTTFTDNVPDYALTDADRLRFDQNIPPAFKFAAMYGERMFGAGFDPITTGTASASGATITVSGITLPDGVVGCWFKADGDNAQYNIIARPTSTTITLDRNYVGTLSGAKYAIYRNPWEVYFSEFQDADAWGPEGEQRRFKLDVPGHQAVTGLCEWNNSLLVFTANNIYAIDGKGPNRTDIRMLPAPVYSGLGALSCDAITRVDNDVYFLSSRGPAAMAGGEPQLVGLVLNYDWLDTLTQAETSIAVAGTDGRDVYFSVPSAPNQTMNSRTYRYEVATKSWWEETGMCPVCFVRADSDNGQKDVLFYLQGEFVWQPNKGTLDGISAAIQGNDNAEINISNNGLQTGSISIFPTDNLGPIECLCNFYAGNKLVAQRRIVPQYPASGMMALHTSDSLLVWSLDSNLPYSGSLAGIEPAPDRAEIGNVSWRWQTKTVEVDAKVQKLQRASVTFDVKGATTCFKTDIVDGVAGSNALKLTAALKSNTWPLAASSRDYSALLSSRDGAVIRHMEAEMDAEASNK